MPYEALSHLSLVCTYLIFPSREGKQKRLPSDRHVLIEYNEGVFCVVRGLCSLRISILERERSRTFLPLAYEIEILSIKENQFIFLLFPQGKCVVPNNETITMGCTENQNNFPLHHVILLSQKRTLRKLTDFSCCCFQYLSMLHTSC